MITLYPSWIEIPAHDLARALAFYRAVFELTDTPRYDEPTMQIVVLRASDKSVERPGVSLVRSAEHRPNPSGVLVNFHVGAHANLAAALERAVAHGGALVGPTVELEDGVRYTSLRDSEGNTIAVSSYEVDAT